MKIKALILILFLVFTASARAATAPRPLIIQGIDIMTWPDDLSAEKALSIFIELMQKDDKAKSVLNQVNSKLNSHGINGLREIFKYCDGEPPAEGATAFFSQGSKIELKLQIPGAPESAWSEQTLFNSQSAFSTKIFRTAFIDFMVMTEKPEICIHKTNELFKAYGSLLHEMTHFLLKNPFQYFEDLLISNSIPNYIHSTINEAGGEFDAFKIGSAASIRLMKRLSIEGHSSLDHQFFSTDGELQDERGLKEYLTKTYEEFLTQTGAIENFNSSTANIIQTQIKILKENVAPWLRQYNNPELNELLLNRIQVLETMLGT